MLSARHKAQILARAGFKVPPCPALPQLGGARTPLQDGAHGHHQLQAAGDPGEPDAAWRRQIDVLYAQYAAERAARSLREAEEARQSASIRPATKA